MYPDPNMNYADITPEEMGFLHQATEGLNENQKRYFYTVYNSKRKNSQEILLFTLLGFVGCAGIQRFILGQIGMGILYILSCGLCFIGTIVDLIKNKSLTLEYNKNMAYESHRMALMTP
ncbi:MAG: hypothetical protein JWQ34_1657 [Mucilaginibacter sp.]|nr:hypothetical protein [Mucilaginibacter sp.]